MTLGDLVKEYRSKNQITMEDFAKQSGLSKGYISMLENNKNPRTGNPIVPSLETIKQCSFAMNVDLNDLINMLDDNQSIALKKENNDDIKLDILNKRIKERRTELGMTLIELGEKIGVRDATIQRYESGEIKNIKRSTVEKLADALKTTPICLIGWGEPSTKQNDFIDDLFEVDNIQNEIQQDAAVTYSINGAQGVGSATIKPKIPNDEYWLIGNGETERLSTPEYYAAKSTVDAIREANKKQ